MPDNGGQLVPQPGNNQPPMTFMQMIDAAKRWLLQFFQAVTAANLQNEFFLSLYAIWQWLDNTDKFRDWSKRAMNRLKLVEGKDFVVSPVMRAKPQGGRPRKDYLLTAEAAQRVIATDTSPKGQALLCAYIEIVRALTAGDEQLIRYGISRMPNAQAATGTAILGSTASQGHLPRSVSEQASRPTRSTWRRNAARCRSCCLCNGNTPSRRRRITC